MCASLSFKVRICKADKEPKGKCAWGYEKNCVFIYKYTPTVCTISFIFENLQENRIRMIKSKEELKVLSDYSTDIFKWNIINKYMDCQKCLSCTIFIILLKAKYFWRWLPGRHSGRRYWW